MKRITVHIETITEDIKVGDIVHDEAGNDTFAVTSINVGPNAVSAQVFGKRVMTDKYVTDEPILTEFATVFVDGDTDVWILNVD